MSALRDSVIIKLLFVKLSCVENIVNWQQLNLYQCLKEKTFYGYKVKATILHKTLKYLFVIFVPIFVCCVELRAKVNSRGQLWFVKTDPC